MEAMEQAGEFWPAERWSDEAMSHALFHASRATRLILRCLAEQVGESVTYSELNEHVYSVDASQNQLAGAMSSVTQNTRNIFGYGHPPFAALSRNHTESGEAEYRMPPETALQVARLLHDEVSERVERLMAEQHELERR